MLRFFLFLLTLLVALPASAQLPGAPLNVPAQLEAETLAPAPGQTVTLAFVMRPKPTWHGYWENGGDAGIGMQLNWDLPTGVTAGKLRYPVPERLIISGLMNYVYEQQYTLLVDLKIDGSVPAGSTLPIRVRGDWLACTDIICVPEGDDLALDLIIGDGEIAAVQRSRFDRYRAALPVPLDQQGKYKITGKTIEVAIPYPADADLDAPYFFPETRKLFAYARPQIARRTGDMLVIKTGVDAFFIDDFEGGPISGLLRYADGQGVLVTAVPGEVPSDGEIVSNGDADAGKTGEPATNFLLILLSSVIGGLILNLMPCVFPILGLKALSLAKLGGNARAAKRDALAYSGGVILSCVALGAVMLVLRAGGEQIGWAFQLQEPRIVLLLLLLMVAIVINLLGGFELSSVNMGDKLAAQSGPAGSFWTGILAAIVATPCTGPFMAAALGAALLLPAVQALALFAGLGLGLALPYLAIAYLPRLRGFLPKPGPWLETFRRIMAIPMALTALALAWLLWRLSGGFGLIAGTGSAILLAGILIIHGRMQKTRGDLSVIAGFAVVALSVATVFVLPRAPIAAAERVSDGVLEEEVYSAEKLAEYRAAGHPVFVYFTADWCVTCKINESTALKRQATADAFESAGVKVLVGDWTRRDPEITRVLARHGRSGVPLYLYYPKDAQTSPEASPRILPQLLTMDGLVQLVK